MAASGCGCRCWATGKVGVGMWVVVLPLQKTPEFQPACMESWPIWLVSLKKLVLSRDAGPLVWQWWNTAVVAGDLLGGTCPKPPRESPEVFSQTSVPVTLNLLADISS